MKLEKMNSGPILVDLPEVVEKQRLSFWMRSMISVTLMKSLSFVGTTLDIMIRIEHDDDDITREVFTENYVQHIDGRYGKRDNVMCITVPV